MNAARLSTLSRNGLSPRRWALWARWLGLCALILGWSRAAAGAEPAAAIRKTLPFHSQGGESTDWHIQEKITPFLTNLDGLHGQLGAPPQTLSAHLDLGGQIEGKIAGEVKGILDFYTTHNGRLANWAAGDPALSAFLERARMTPRQVKELRAKYPKWPYHPPLWAVEGIRTGQAYHEIPKDGLQLDYQAWLGDAAIDGYVRKFAFFHFLRKACTASQTEAAFLDDQTGYRSHWNVAGKPVQFGRWHHKDYYTYRFIAPAMAPNAPPGSLKAEAATWCIWRPEAGELKAFYEAKLQLFLELAAEMSRGAALAAGADPYLRFYGFLCRSFPCVSAFQVEPMQPDGWQFVRGYPGDRPAAASGEPKFHEHSPVGIAFGLAQRLAQSPQKKAPVTLYRELLSPILLLQFRLPAESLNRLESFPYEDLKVGYKGYLDLYYELTGSPEASVLAAERGGTP